MARQKTALTDIIQELLAKKHMLTAPQVLAALRYQDLKYNKTSIYRALEKLLAEGRLCKISLGENDVHYELRNDHHDHFVCSNCGTMTTIQCQVEKIALPEGFTADHHHLTVFGMCANCKK